VFSLGAVLIAGFGYAWASDPPAGHAPALPVPSFSGSATTVHADGAPPRTTLLPTDCAAVLPGPTDMAALLAKPTGSVGVRTVVGVPSPQVGQLERLTCNYQVPGVDGSGLVLTLTAFADPAAASAQRARNVAAEQSDTRAVRPGALGAAEATLLAQPGRRMLMVAHQRYTLTAILATGVVPDQHIEAVLTDLAQRVLPNLAPPTRGGTPGPTPEAAPKPTANPAVGLTRG
jgi:hypothetical protein